MRVIPSPFPCLSISQLLSRPHPFLPYMPFSSPTIPPFRRVLSRISYQVGVSKYQGVLPSPFPSLFPFLPFPSPCPPFPLPFLPLEVGSPYTSPSLFFLPFHSLPFPSLSLVVAPCNPARGSGGAL